MFRTGHSPPPGSLTYEEQLQISRTIFSRAINMRDLRSTDPVDWSSSQVWDLFDALESKMSLERLALRIGGDSPYLLSMLRAQTGLKHLELLKGGKSQIRLQDIDLPELMSLKATLVEAAIIVPGRPVEKLELIHYHDPHMNPKRTLFTESLFRQLASSECGITDFTMRLRRPWDDVFVGQGLRLVARYLPRIQRLRIFVGGMVSESIVSPCFCIRPLFWSASMS